MLLEYLFTVSSSIVFLLFLCGVFKLSHLCYSSIFSLFLHPLFSYYFFAEYSMYLTHLFLLFLQAVEVYPFNAPGIFGYFSSKFFGKETIDELLPSVGPPSLSSVAGAASK